jgi:hypothetical protein
MVFAGERLLASTLGEGAQIVEHDPENGNYFSEKIMLH